MIPHPPEFDLSLTLALVAASTTPVLLLDGNLAVIAASDSFCSAFQIDASRTHGCLFADMGEGEWNVPQLLSLLRVTVSGFAEVENFEVKLERNDHHIRCLIVNAKKLRYDDVHNDRLFLSIADITDARAAEKLKDDLLREKNVLLQELHHRVANSLQIIASVLMQSARKVQSDETRMHLYDAHQRVISVAALQQQLAISQKNDVELRPYLSALCDSIRASMIHDREMIFLDVNTDDSITAADTSISIGLIVTELVINALKHAFPGNRGGRIRVNYYSQGSDWTLSVDDDGIGMPGDPANAKPGLGTSIVQALAAQLGAEIGVEQGHPGTKVSLRYVHVHAAIAKAAVLAKRAV